MTISGWMMMLSLAIARISLFGALLFAPQLAWAACTWVGNTGTAANANDEGVQECITDAASKSGAVTIVIPSTNGTWNSNVRIDMSSGWSSVTALTVQGGGTSNTVITDGTTTGTGSLNTALWVTTRSGLTFRLTGIRFLSTSSQGGSEGVIALSGTGTDWRLDHFAIYGNPTRGINIVDSYTYGLIDNFLCAGDGQPFNCILISWDSTGIGSSWSRTYFPLMGGAESVFVEDSTFYFPSANAGNVAIDARAGAKYTFRYNILTNTAAANHGTCGTAYRASMIWEGYRNYFTATDSAAWLPFGYMRGGTGVLFDNTVADTGADWNYFSQATDWLTCAGIGSYICVDPWDDLGRCTTYPCQDQVGRATDQALTPAYIWSNSFRATNGTMTVQNACTGPSPVDHIVANRDFYNGISLTAQTSASSPFDGTTGVGHGVAAYRPTTCTAGVGYWATDEGAWNQTTGGVQGRLYKCTGDAWTLYYTPYRYPHPLQAYAAPSGGTITLGGTGTMTPGAGGTITLSP